MEYFLGERSVHKSSSANILSFQTKHATVPVRKTSLNATSLQSNTQQYPQNTKIEVNKNTLGRDDNKPNLTLDISLANKTVFGKEENNFSPEVRMRKIHKAKEEFLKTPISAPSYISEEALQYPRRNR